MKAKTAAVIGNMSKREADALCRDVLRLLRAVRDELRDDRFAPVDALPRADVRGRMAALPTTARTADRELTTQEPVRRFN